MRWNSVLEINLNTIRENYKKLKQLSTSEVAAAVKANSYGLGATHISPILQNEGCKKFFTANINEAISLRKILNSGEIFVLNGIFPGEEKYFLENNLTAVLSDFYQIENLNKYSCENSLNIEAALYIETGMNRFGLKIDDLNSFGDKIQKFSNINFKYVISHLACSDEANNPSNDLQLRRFNQLKQFFPGAYFSIANSGGIMLSDQFHQDFVRAGASIYGINVREDMRLFGNPVRLFSPLIQVKMIEVGEGLGYNHTYLAKEQVLVGTIPLGYADGVSRALSNKGKCYINGFVAPIIGRVSMDLLNIDLSNIPKEYLYLGQEVEIINNLQTPDHLASEIGTVGYEIITSLGNRFERIYVK
jgi:alanine racemase